MRKSIMYVGMNQHKESIEIATAEEGRKGEVRRYGRIDGELNSSPAGCTIYFQQISGSDVLALTRRIGLSDSCGQQLEDWTAFS
jgi:hypothetical protein